MPPAIRASSAGVAAAVRRGAAATNAPLFCATANAAAISGTLPSFTRLCTLPTRSKEIQPTKLATIVKKTAPPIPR